MTTPILTIGIPTYQRVERLREQVLALLRYLPMDAEILVSDNASTDGTVPAVLAIAESDPRVRIIRNRCNLGPDVNFLRILEEAAGTWCWLVGDDDPVDPSLLPELVATLRSCAAGVVHLVAPEASLPAGAPRVFASAEEFIRGFYDLGRFSYLSCNVLRSAPSRQRLRFAYTTCGRLHAYTAVSLGLLVDGEPLTIVDLPIVLPPPTGRRPRWNQVRARLGAWTTLRDTVPAALRTRLDHRAAEAHSRAILLGALLHVLGLRAYDLTSADYSSMWEVSPWRSRVALGALGALRWLTRWPRLAALAVVSLALIVRGRSGPAQLAEAFLLPPGVDLRQAVVRALEARAQGRELDAWEEA